MGESIKGPKFAVGKTAIMAEELRFQTQLLKRILAEMESLTQRVSNLEETLKDASYRVEVPTTLDKAKKKRCNCMELSHPHHRGIIPCSEPAARGRELCERCRAANNL